MVMNLIGNVGNTGASLQGAQFFDHLRIGFGHIPATTCIQLGSSIIMVIVAAHTDDKGFLDSPRERTFPYQPEQE